MRNMRRYMHTLDRLDQDVETVRGVLRALGVEILVLPGELATEPGGAWPSPPTPTPPTYSTCWPRLAAMWPAD
ncbi:MAG: hypothetical protein LBG60_11575 [Bifidobacteriaceae bacterium]|jgi:hypothetical protein|nr:hypothetical protein [Bifidobacteriaceae bacterium]